MRRCSPGYTKEPWPCCGKAVEYQRKKTDGLCADCSDLMADGRKFRELAARGDEKSFMWWQRAYAMPSCGDRNVDEALHALVGVSADVRLDDSADWNAPKMIESNHERAHDWRCEVRATQALRDAVNELHAQIRTALTNRYAEGKERGSSLLLSLQAGEITVGEFEQKTGRSHD